MRPIKIPTQPNMKHAEALFSRGLSPNFALAFAQVFSGLRKLPLTKQPAAWAVYHIAKIMITKNMPPKASVKLQFRAGR